MSGRWFRKKFSELNEINPKLLVYHNQNFITDGVLPVSLNFITKHIIDLKTLNPLRLYFFKKKNYDSVIENIDPNNINDLDNSYTIFSNPFICSQIITLETLEGFKE